MTVIEIDPGVQADIDECEAALGRSLTGDLEEGASRVFRLDDGVDGRRRGGHNQTVRITVPCGSVQPDRLEVIDRIADESSRGSDHITTRRNIQRHDGRPERIPEAVAEGRRGLDRLPGPDEHPAGDVDLGETGPYGAEIGDPACA